MWGSLRSWGTRKLLKYLIILIGERVVDGIGKHEFSEAHTCQP